MKTRTAVLLALTMSGKYDIPGEFLTVTGLDAYGQPVTEKIPAVDQARLEADADTIMAGEDRR